MGGWEKGEVGGKSGEGEGKETGVGTQKKRILKEEKTKRTSHKSQYKLYKCSKSCIKVTERDVRVIIQDIFWQATVILRHSFWWIGVSTMLSSSHVWAMPLQEVEKAKEKYSETYYNCLSHIQRIAGCKALNTWILCHWVCALTHTLISLCCSVL